MVAGAERLPASSTAYTSIVFTMPSVNYIVNKTGMERVADHADLADDA